jgi:hypothetical protein
MSNREIVKVIIIILVPNTVHIPEEASAHPAHTLLTLLIELST